MRRSFVKRGVLFVFITAVILGTVLFIFFNRNFTDLVPVSNNSIIAYHESLEKSDEIPSDISEVKDGTAIGTLSGKADFLLRKKAEYTDLLTEASLERGEVGALPGAYVKILNENSARFGDTVSYSGVYGNYLYELVNETEVNGEQAVFAVPKENSSLVIYFQRRGDAGIASEYKVLIYEEAD